MPKEYFKAKCVKTLSNWDIPPTAYESCLRDARAGGGGGEELGPGPSEGLDQAQRRWFSDLHAAKPTGSQHGFAGLSSVTSPAQEDPQSMKICNIG